MAKPNVEFTSDQGETLVFNAFSTERYFNHEDMTFVFIDPNASIDKFAGIEEMLSANISQLTHRAHEE